MKRALIAAFLLVFGYAVQTAAAQNPAAGRGAAAAAPRPQAYPDRPKASQSVLDQGKALYGVSCAFCHGSDAGGGEVGPNLLRSGVVLEDQSGELIAPIVHGARVDRGMPRIDLTDAQISNIAAWLHSLHVTSHPDSDATINIVTGNASVGEAYFKKTCASCHSVTGDLAGLATRIPNAKALQQTWLLPGSSRGGPGVGGAIALHVPPITVTVTLPGGKKVEGSLVRIDDFYVGLRQTDGTLRSFDRVGDVPKVEIHDPLAPHRALVPTYTDKDIHDLTAYLVTIK